MFASSLSACARTLPTTDDRLPTRRRRSRRGISLLEVLISMFVLLFGLMGVAAIFPVGNHYAGRGEQYDRTAALMDQAFAEIKARGLMNPQNWVYAEPLRNADSALGDAVALVMQPVSAPDAGKYNMNPGATQGPGHAFVVDPLGTAELWTPILIENPSAKRLDPSASSEIGASYFPFGYYTAQNPTGSAGDDRIVRSSNTLNPWHPSTGYTPALPGDRWPLRRISLATPDPRTSGRPWAMPAGVAENVFRLPDDLANQEPEQDDRPGHLRWRSEIVGAPDDPGKFDPGNAASITYANDIPLARASSGSYSWIATIVPAWQPPPLPGSVTIGANGLQPAHPHYRNMMCDVSVAVFYKRAEEPNAENERSINAAINVGGELVLYADNTPDGAEAVDNAVRDLRPGNWIAVAGVNPTNGLFLLKWYKLLSLDTETVRGERINPSTGAGPVVALRRATLEGPDWPPPPAGGATVGNLRAIIMPGVIGVSTKTMRVAPVR